MTYTPHFRLIVLYREEFRLNSSAEARRPMSAKTGSRRSVG